MVLRNLSHPHSSAELQRQVAAVHVSVENLFGLLRRRGHANHAVAVAGDVSGESIKGHVNYLIVATYFSVGTAGRSDTPEASATPGAIGCLVWFLDDPSHFSR